jgi:hypothetical protein
MTPMEHLELAVREITRDPDQFKKPDKLVHLLRQAYGLGYLDGGLPSTAMQVPPEDDAWVAIEVDAWSI